MDKPPSFITCNPIPCWRSSPCYTGMPHGTANLAWEKIKPRQVKTYLKRLVHRTITLRGRISRAECFCTFAPAAELPTYRQGVKTKTKTMQFREILSIQRCKCFFFDAGTEKFLGAPFKALLTRPDHDRKALFIGLTFPADFPFHRSVKATAQRVSAFISGGWATREGIDHYISTLTFRDI